MGEKKEKVRSELISDCFGVVAGKKHCHILIEDVCLYGECPFYKTREQYNADRKKYEALSTGRVLGRCQSEAVTKRRSGRKIRCIETGKVYASIRLAAEDLGMLENTIKLVLSGRQSQTCGLSFKYVEE